METRSGRGFGTLGSCTVSALALAALALVPGCKDKGAEPGAESAKPTQQKLVIQNSGSDTMVNLAQMWAEQYQQVAPGVTVEVSGGGSGVGIRDLMQGIVHIANASRKMKDSEKAQTKQNTGKEPIEWITGYDAMAIYAHKDNPVEQLTIAQLADVYVEGGKTDKWSQLGVNLGDASDEIVRVSRQNSSGTYFFFREHVLNKRDFKLGSRDMSGSKDVVELVGKTKGAIGYSGMGYKIDAVKFVKIAKAEGEIAWAPSLANVTSGNYSLARPLHMYTLGQPTGHVKVYLDWILSPAGQKIVEQSGYVSVGAATASK